jgi:hypothetical protein
MRAHLDSLRVVNFDAQAHTLNPRGFNFSTPVLVRADFLDIFRSDWTPGVQKTVFDDNPLKAQIYNILPWYGVIWGGQIKGSDRGSRPVTRFPAERPR